MQTEDTYSNAYEQALRFLGPRFLSRQELAAKLSRKGYSKSVIEEVLQKLTELDYINDERLAGQVLRLYVSEEKYGAAWIRRKMGQRGLDTPPSLKEYDELAAGRQVLLKKFPYPEENRPDFGKVARYLTNRGFSPQTVRTLWQELSEHS